MREPATRPARSGSMSLRKRNQIRLRRRVQAHALDLMEDRGFDGVSVEDVAAAADISPSTVYRHFGTKQRLVLWDESDARIEAQLTELLGTLPPFDALREAFVVAYTEVERDELELHRRRGELVNAEPALRAALAGELERARVELQDALRLAYRSSLSDVEAELLARIALAAFLTGFEAWQRSWPSGLLPRAIRRAFDVARSVVG